jgi:uncharacterized protein
MNWSVIYRKRGLYIRTPVAVAMVFLVVMGWHWLWPMVPGKLVMSAGGDKGAYYAYAQRYKSALAARGIELTVLASDGTPHNLKRLQAGEGERADLALAQGGFGLLSSSLEQQGDKSIQTIGNIGVEPLWIVSAGADVSHLSQLLGLRVGVAGPLSGSRHVLRQLLDLYRLKERDMTLVELSGFDLVRALESGQVDVAVHVATSDSAVVQRLLDLPQARLVQLSQTAAIAQHLPHLEPRLLHKGQILGRRLQPDRDISIMSTYASVLVRHDVPAALVRQVADVLRDAHKEATVLSRPGEFPSQRQPDFPFSLEATQALAKPLPWWESQLPFFWSQVLQRVTLLVLPAILLGMLMIKMMTGLAARQVERRLHKWYGELQLIEEDMQLSDITRLRHELHRRRLLGLERAVDDFVAPLEWMHKWFTLREHISYVAQGSDSLRGR